MIEHLDYQTFKTAYASYLDRKAKPKIKNRHSQDSTSNFSSSKGWVTGNESWTYRRNPTSPNSQPKKKEESLYDKFEYGLSDW